MCMCHLFDSYLTEILLNLWIFTDYVRSLDDILPKCTFKGDRPRQADDKAVEIFTKILKKTKIRFDASLFKNPKLQTQIANIEALALDLETRILPPDSTRKIILINN